MSLKRATNWAIDSYHKFLVESTAKPFAWGTWDCSMFAADGIQAITGTDVAAEFRGKYTDESGAFALIKQVTGGSTVADAAAWVAKEHGMAELTHPLMAQRGDLVVFEAPTGALVAGLVHLNGRHIISVGEQGLYRFPISQIKRAWHY